MINALAQELNQTLAGSVVDSLFSKMGERLYFPNGIISQGGEAAKDATFANGTIGMAVVNGTPIELDSYKKSMPNFNAREVVAYAKTGGNPELRKIWKEQIISKNPLLKGKNQLLAPHSLVHICTVSSSAAKCTAQRLGINSRLLGERSVRYWAMAWAVFWPVIWFLSSIVITGKPLIKMATSNASAGFCAS